MKIVNAIYLSNADNCVTLAETADAGDTVRFFDNGREVTVTVPGHIPIWHKMAVKPVEKGSGVCKYGAVIGLALEDIGVGHHIHVHNIRSPGAGG